MMITLILDDRCNANRAVTGRIKRKRSTYETGRSADETIGRLALKYRHYWKGEIESFQSRLVGEVEGVQTWVAFSNAHPHICGYGTTSEEALGAAIRNHHKAFKTKIVFL